MQNGRRRVVRVAFAAFGAVVIMATPQSGAQPTRTVDVELVFATDTVTLGLGEFDRASTEMSGDRVIDLSFHQPGRDDGGLHLRLVNAGTYRGVPVLYGLATFTDPLTGVARAGEVAGYDMTTDGRREIVAAIHDNRDGGRRVPFRLVFDPLPSPEPTGTEP